MASLSSAALSLAALTVAWAFELSGCSDASSLDIPDREVCLLHVDGSRYCIDVYEASRRDATATFAGDDVESPPASLEGRMPWVDITWASARTACAKKNKRLCERDEWIDACDGVPGPGGAAYAYGDPIDEAGTRCNTRGSGAEPSGARGACEASTGTFDQSGNVWEWTGGSNATAVARGGGWPSSREHGCTSGDARAVFEPGARSFQLGFRCCRG